ncbi:MAG TPA: histidine kinase [Vicinamibacterales bacterium]|nr:histidine kinase [Vicinamibacterales bacterium]
MYVAMAVAITFVFSDVSDRASWRTITEAIGVALLFSVCIGPMTSFAMPRLAPLLWCRFGFPFNWIAITLSMTAFALAGSAVAIFILTLIGYLPTNHFWHWYYGSMRISVAVTLTVGLFITLHEMNKARLAQASTQAQLASLENRVQPHFLFNTLNSIAALTHEDPAGAEKMTTQLASLLRSSLDGPNSPLVPLGDELTLVRHYLDIERVRFGDRLRYSIDTDAPAAEVRVPRMSIQTLVENSVKYAVSPRREGGTIAVRASLRDGRLRVDVTDDGAGFDAIALPDGHGLALLRARLQMLFADRGSLDITNDPTTVSLCVPSSSTTNG